MTEFNLDICIQNSCTTPLKIRPDGTEAQSRKLKCRSPFGTDFLGGLKGYGQMICHQTVSAIR